MDKSETVTIFLIIVVTAVVLFNQYQIFSVNNMISGKSTGVGVSFFNSGGSSDIADVNVLESKSTAQSISLLFPVEQIATVDDAIAVMLPAGTPEYGDAMGVSFDDPVGSLTKLQRAFPGLQKEMKENHPEAWQRYLNLATKPVGISCEYCCGVGPIGINPDGSSRCGCSHNPAVHSVTMWLMMNTEYADAEVLREVLKWKTAWFPKNMVTLAYQVATQGAPTAGDAGGASGLDQLGNMVGGC